MSRRPARGGPLALAAALACLAKAGGAAVAAPAPAAADPGDWRADAPGVVHRVDPARLPAPYASTLGAAEPQVVPRPAGAQLHVPPGFEVDAWASGLDGPRTLRVAPNGDVFVAESNAGRVRVLRPAAGGRGVASVSLFARGLDRPSGLAFFPEGAHPRWLYVSEVNRVVRYAYAEGATAAVGPPEVVVPRLFPRGGKGHWTRDLAFSADGRTLYIAVGSASNVAEQMPRKDAAGVQAWEAAHGFGTAWDNEENRAAVLATDPEGKAPLRAWASGLRNCAALTRQPGTGALWCTVNERDLLGDDLVPDYSTRLAEGGFYGWPWYYLGDHEDPRLAGQRPDLRGKVRVPDVLYQAHSAPLGLAFYQAGKGEAAFPAEFTGDGFAALHGSWNRSRRTGYKLVRVRLHAGQPTGAYEDFLTGFVADDGHVWGRPVSVAQATDGALLASDDAGGVVWRISWHGP